MANRPPNAQYGRVNTNPPSGNANDLDEAFQQLTLAGYNKQRIRRKDAASAGVLTNYFPIDFGQVKTIYCYKLLLTTKNASDFSRRVVRRAVLCFLKQFPPPVPTATNYSDLLVTVRPLPADYLAGNKIVTHVDEDDPPRGRQNATNHTFANEFKSSYEINGLKVYLSKPEANATQFPQAHRDEVVTMLNIFFSHRPNQYTVRQLLSNVVPKVAQVGVFKFFTLEGGVEPQWSDVFRIPQGASLELGRGLEARIGFFKSVRLSSSQKALLNVNRVTTAFYQARNLLQLIKTFKQYPTSDPARNPHAKWTEVSLAHVDIFIKGLRVKTTYFGQSKAPGGRREEKIFTISGLARTSKDSDPTVADDPTAEKVNFAWAKEKGGSKEAITVKDFFSRHHRLNIDGDGYVVVVGGKKSEKKKDSGASKKTKESDKQGKEKDPIYLPAQYCEVLSGQPYRRLLSNEQVAVMIKFAAKRPYENKQQIETSGLQLFGIPQDQTHGPLSNFGLGVHPAMLRVEGRRLPAPNLAYRATGNKEKLILADQTSRGSWNLMSKPLFARCSTKSVKWSIVEMHREVWAMKNEDFEYFFTKFDQAMVEYGLTKMVKEESSSNDYHKHRFKLSKKDEGERERKDEAKIRELFQNIRQKGKVDLLFVFIPSKDAELYSLIKTAGDVVSGLITICAVSNNNVLNGHKYWGPKADETTKANYMMKANLKLGGTNQMLQKDIMPFDTSRTIFIGMDVTHPGPLSLNQAPSIVTVVSTIEGNFLGQWPASIRTQVPNPQKQSKEIIEDLRPMIEERLYAWMRNNKGSLPEQMIIYRDGVSEGQFDLVREREIPQIDHAIDSLYKAPGLKKPRILHMCAIKRHHTRFYPPDRTSSHVDQKTANFHPGLIVDRDITYDTGVDWFLQSHAALQGTAVPTHYKILRNDLQGVSIESIQQMTHDMCFIFGRCTKSVSIHPAAYYADLACERVRVWMRRAYIRHIGEGNPVDYDPAYWNRFVQPHPDLRNCMWYI